MNDSRHSVFTGGQDVATTEAYRSSRPSWTGPCVDRRIHQRASGSAGARGLRWVSSRSAPCSPSSVSRSPQRLVASARPVRLTARDREGRGSRGSAAWDVSPVTASMRHIIGDFPPGEVTFARIEVAPFSPRSSVLPSGRVVADLPSFPARLRPLSREPADACRRRSNCGVGVCLRYSEMEVVNGDTGPDILCILWGG